MALYQEHLDILSDALLSGDPDRFMARVTVPHVMQTATHRHETITAEAQRALFTTFANLFRSEGITAFVRTARFATFVSPNVIVGQHDSHKMRGAHRTLAPYPNRVRLARGADDIWRETHCANAVQNLTGSFAQPPTIAADPQVPDLHPDFRKVPL